MFEAFTLQLDNIYITVLVVTNLFRQIVGIPMGTKCALLEAGLFLFRYERDFCLFLKKSNLKLVKLSARRLGIWTVY